MYSIDSTYSLSLSKKSINSSRIITIQDNLLNNGVSIYDLKPYFDSDRAKDSTISSNLSLLEYLKQEKSSESCSSMYVCLVISVFLCSLMVFSTIYRIDDDNQNQVSEKERRSLFRKAFVS